MSRRIAAFIGTLTLVSSLVISGGASATAAGASWTASRVVTGLAIPRGIAFDGAGGMYVAESGLPGPGGFGSTTGSVDKYLAGQRQWTTPFPSAYMGDGTRPPDVIGPTGLSAVGNGCTKSSQGARNGCQVLMIMGLNQHEVPNGQAGHLYRLDAFSGQPTDRADVGDQNYAWTLAHNNLWNEFPDSNPYGVLITHGGSAASHNTFVVDAGANTVSEVAADGTATVIAYIPNEVPLGTLPTRDATPTCAAQGPDGALYVGTLDLIRNFVAPQQGWSHVYRVDPDDPGATPTVWASGLTTITSCTFDSAGNFWGTEMFKNNKNGPPGDVVRIPFSDPAHPEHIGGGSLPLPGGIAQGGDGAMYVTTFSAGTALPIGAVVRLIQG